MKEPVNKILGTVVVVALFLFVLNQITKQKERQKEIEIGRKLELVDLDDLRSSFATRCVDILSEIEGLQSFLSTKKLFTDEEVKELGLDDSENDSLRIEDICEGLGESDAISKPFSYELSRIERVYDPSDYEIPMDETYRLSY